MFNALLIRRTTFAARHVRLTRVLVLAILMGAAPRTAGTVSAHAAPDEATFERGLVVGRVGSGGRRPFQTDAIEFRIVRGDWTRPTEGASATGDDAGPAWSVIEASEEGVFRHRSLRGGYLYLTYESPADRVMILEARGGFSSARINGEARPGDSYNTGWIHLPVLMHEGANEFLFQVTRGELRPTLREPEAPVYLEARDSTLPQLLVGESGPFPAGMLLVNASRDTQDDLAIVVRGPDGRSSRTRVPSVPPLLTTKVRFAIPGPGPSTTEGTTTFDLAIVRNESPETPLWTGKVTIDHAETSEPHTRTFVSSIDRSAQYYAVRPASDDGDPTTEPGMTLSLHGASVEARNQRNQYGAKDWTMVIAPTNRRPYGFDWEDWGRMDAMEVLAHASDTYPNDPYRRWLTGHSMGGHGTWMLGATYPDRFAAIGPSAGWTSFWSYTGAFDPEQREGITGILRRATHGSRTLELKRNYETQGVYILHGDRDNNVPVAQARRMVRTLAEYHKDFAYHEQRGAGHWWGAQCCDWPPMFEFFRHFALDPAHTVRHVRFVTASPGISASNHWATINAQTHALAFSEIDLRWNPEERTVSGTTSNVSHMTLDLKRMGSPEALAIELDGQQVDVGNVRERERLVLVHDDGRWRVDAPRSATGVRKRPARYGPFKEVYSNDVLLVYGTGGTPDERTWARSKARFDAETFWYRGNGSFDVISDAAYDPEAHSGRNVVLYGNASTNRAWDALLGHAPLRFESGVAKIGDRSFRGSFAGLFIYPHATDESVLLGAVTGTDVAALRSTTRLPIFVSGVAYPDVTIFTPDVWRDTTDAVVGAGFYGPDWSIARGDFAWVDEEAVNGNE